MRIRTILGQGLRALARNRLRSSLTILGVAIGIGAVVCVVAIGNAGSAQIQQHLENLGDNLIWIEAGSRTVDGRRTGPRNVKTLVVDDVDAILREVPLIKSCSAHTDSRVQVVYGNQNWNLMASGATPEFLQIRRWRMATGAMFSHEAVERAANVCVLGATTRQWLFPNEDPIGKTIRVANVPFTVIGTLEPKGMSSTGRDQDDNLIMPFTTMSRKIEGMTWLEDLMCSAVSTEAIKPASDQITLLLRQRHRIQPDQLDDFSIRSPEDQIQAQLNASRTMTLLLVAVGSVSLLVGGIGIMNVMLVSVTERTREIGVRLAVGATEAQVQTQFLSEAIMLCMMGGAVGLLFGAGGTFLLSSTLGWAMKLSVEALTVATLFSIAIGVFFGYYPAQKAARLDPIAALRYE